MNERVPGDGSLPSVVETQDLVQTNGHSLIPSPTLQFQVLRISRFGPGGSGGRGVGGVNGIQCRSTINRVGTTHRQGRRLAVKTICLEDTPAQTRVETKGQPNKGTPFKGLHPKDSPSSL